MSDKTIKIVFKAPNYPPQILEVKNCYPVFRDLIKGFLETVWLEKGLLMVCDEEGKIKKLRKNFLLPQIHDIICGPVFFCSANAEGDFTSLNDEQLALAKKLVEEN